MTNDTWELVEIRGGDLRLLLDLVGRPIESVKANDAGIVLRFEGARVLEISEWKQTGRNSDLGTLVGHSLSNVEGTERSTDLTFSNGAILHVEHCIDYAVGPEVMFLSVKGELVGVW